MLHLSYKKKPYYCIEKSVATSTGHIRNKGSNCLICIVNFLSISSAVYSMYKTVIISNDVFSI